MENSREDQGSVAGTPDGVSALPVCPPAGSATPSGETLDRVWARAEAAFPAADGFGLEIGRHAAGFYHTSIHRRFPNEAFAMLAYETGADLAAILNAAIDTAERNLRLGIDWLAADLPARAEGRDQ